MRKVVVFDSAHPGAIQNKCFEKEYANKGAGHSFTVELAKQSIANGFEIMTGDVFLKNGKLIDQKALLITDMCSSITDKLIASGATPFLNYSLESPLIARKFYQNLNRIAGRYMYNIQFKGTKPRFVGSSTEFEQMHFPVDDIEPLSIQNWNNRKYLTIINSNKRVFRTDYSDVKSSIHSFFSEVKFSIDKVMDPWMRSKEVYRDRIEMIRYFSKYNDFELYGYGWNKKIVGFSENYSEAAKASFKGGISYSEKYSTLNRFKFNICFENCEFPGYVTEKIFDSFLAGSIPIYYGAPDILDFVPETTFIDFRKFGSPESLDKYLKLISENQANVLLSEAQKFLLSEDFQKHSLKTFISNIISKIIKA